ncbi:Membrane peptidase [Actinidia chinensis var. chinensis]|uniref:Membrane peptidase n=1 Tax=Actinidia chinensis var. chinensis TaxID=1590841 RepID=A0A2R6QQX0_ACTCC|nr:Membrane peptidase [Actinidia chinensis var. chinensis]
MVSTMLASLAQSSLSSLSLSPTLFSSKTLTRRTEAVLSRHRNFSHWFSLSQSNRALRFPGANTPLDSSRGRHLTCFYKENELDWPILKRWDVPWEWQTVSLTSLACGLSFVLTGLIETAAIPYLGLQIGELSSDEKAEILFLDQAITTAVVLVVLYSITNTFQPRRDDLFRYDLSEPFGLQKGWLLWAGVGLIGALMAIGLTGAALSLFSGENTPRETDALVLLLPLIGSSSISTACLVGITGVLAPLLEETVFRGFFMVSLTKWLPTPVSILISAAVFAVAHLTPGQFPQLFVLGTALGFSYAQTRNLLTPITIHAIWNSGVILFLTFLQLQGYDIKELLQAS